MDLGSTGKWPIMAVGRSVRRRGGRIASKTKVIVGKNAGTRVINHMDASALTEGKTVADEAAQRELRLQLLDLARNQEGRDS